MEDVNKKTKEEIWHDNEARKFLGDVEEEGKIYPEQTDPATLRSKYSAKNPYGEEMFNKEDFLVKDPTKEAPQEEYIKIKKSWLEGLRDFDTWTKWKNGLIEYK